MLALASAAHDTVYTAPRPEPWEAMPVGGGDLSAMVRWDGSLRLHLTKSDAWGFQEPPDAPIGSRFFNNVSPGHARVSFPAAVREFRQRLDVKGGRVVFQLDGASIEIRGDPHRKVLVIEIDDPKQTLGAPELELSEWRPEMQVGCAPEGLIAREIHQRPARPHLANTGMEDYFGPSEDPMLGRGLGVVVAASGAQGCSAPGLTAKTALPGGSRRILIAAAVTRSGDPVAAARAELASAGTRGAHRSWWRDYWSRSYIRLSSPDGEAERLVRAYHIHLYTLASVNRGTVPAKWDGGPGLLVNDQRTWGLSEWVQEIRFTYWPLYAANQPEMAAGLFRHYSAMLPYLEQQTRNMWGVPGIWIPETVLPWGHAEDFALHAAGRNVVKSFQRWDPRNAHYGRGRFEAYNPYVGFLFTSGLELSHHYLTYARHAGGQAFERERAYPMVKGVVEFVSALLAREADGRYHLEPANALESWWMVRDPADTLAGIAAIFPEFIRLSEKYSRDAPLREKCRGILRSLAEPPRGVWLEDGSIHSAPNAYAPAVSRTPKQAIRNSENPALYRVAPFGLSGIGSSDLAVARETFAHRIRSLSNGWSMDPLWAARLGLGEEASRLLAGHARKFNRFPYGGWTSNDSRFFPNGLSATPYLDAGGLSAVALQETLLQSHNGLIRILPAVSKTWSGAFELHAEGGFLVSAEFEHGKATAVRIRSLLGGNCNLVNPWTGKRETIPTTRRGSFTLTPSPSHKGESPRSSRSPAAP